MFSICPFIRPFVRLFVCYQLVNMHFTLKTNEPISMQIITNLPPKARA